MELIALINLVPLPRKFSKFWKLDFTMSVGTKAARSLFVAGPRRLYDNMLAAGSNLNTAMAGGAASDRGEGGAAGGNVFGRKNRRSASSFAQFGCCIIGFFGFILQSHDCGPREDF